MDKGKTHSIQVFAIVFLFFVVVSVSTEPNPRHSKDSKHFVLIHGVCLGAWSWYKLIPLLESSGHRVTAIDLAASGINLIHASDLQTFSDYSKPLMDFMASLNPHQRVILVGHSMGGASISQAMEHFPEKVSVSVFVTAAMPGPSIQYSVIHKQLISRLGSSLDNKVTRDEGPNNPRTTFTFGPKYISEVLFQYSPAEDSALAYMLVRPSQSVSTGELIFSEEKYGSVKRVFIICEEDQVITEQFQKWMIEKNPPDRVEKIAGSDHMVMMSKPTQLLAHLLSIAQDYS